MSDCETCWYYDYDEENDVNFCRQFLDEDEVARLLQRPDARCPYYRSGDEYEVAKKQ
ncbi:MAG: DUF6472 family protein [Oscillospiraceae bacterium]|nr:DUF6472 family protein [Oscillospiraceae bacterium]